MMEKSNRHSILVWCAIAFSLTGLGGCAQTQSYYGTQYDAYAPPDKDEYFPEEMDGGPRPVIPPVAPKRVAFANSEKPGTIIIDSGHRKLYLTLGPGVAYQYPISVGREGFAWTGTEKISRVADWPDWYPPEEMRERDPRLPKKMLGGIKNPLGAKALFLGNTLYRIHGTNDPNTIGYAASSGCFRMLNEHVVHLASFVNVGTTVKVLPSLNALNASPSDPAASKWKAAPKAKPTASAAKPKTVADAGKSRT
ncbi:MAG: L,D-transpeptidase family protein [Hyphomicrobiaceae bacterium]|nr:L,D-transpeptidase family protein [Hyphomicrobiaceae bacterium]